MCYYSGPKFSLQRMHCHWSFVALVAMCGATFPLALVEVVVTRLAIEYFGYVLEYLHSMHLVCCQCLAELEVVVMVVTFLLLVCPARTDSLVTLHLDCDQHTYSVRCTVARRTIVATSHNQHVDIVDSVHLA